MVPEMRPRILELVLEFIRRWFARARAKLQTLKLHNRNHFLHHSYTDTYYIIYGLRWVTLCVRNPLHLLSVRYGVRWSGENCPTRRFF